MKIKLLQELDPSPRTLKAISSTRPTKVQITSGKINVLETTNIETIIPIRYLLFYRTKIIEFYEYPEDRVKGNNFINHQTKRATTLNHSHLKHFTDNKLHTINIDISTINDIE